MKKFKVASVASVASQVAAVVPLEAEVEAGAREEEGAAAISAAIAKIEKRVVEIAEETGARYTFYLSEHAAARNKESATSGEMILALFSAITGPIESVVVDRRNAKWGLHYNRSLVTAPSTRVDVLLRDAPLEARKRFLDRASEFAEAYRAQADGLRALRRKEREANEAIAAQADKALKTLG